MALDTRFQPIGGVYDVADLNAQLVALQSARWSGTLSVSYLANGVTRTIQYKSDAQMAAAIADLERRIDELQGVGRVRNIVVRGRRGWEKEEA
jgi:uncharacterized protein YcbX